MSKLVARPPSHSMAISILWPETPAGSCPMRSSACISMTLSERSRPSCTVAWVPFYDGTRLHSSLDYVPPETFERLT
jgi:hypothetical protein